MSNKKYDLLIEKLAYKYNKPEKVIKKLVESQFEFISREKMKELDLSSIDSKEEFDKTKKNFNIKYLFVLHPSWGLINKLKTKKKDGEESNKTKD